MSEDIPPLNNILYTARTGRSRTVQITGTFGGSAKGINPGAAFQTYTTVFSSSGISQLSGGFTCGGGINVYLWDNQTGPSANGAYNYQIPISPYAYNGTPYVTAKASGGMGGPNMVITGSAPPGITIPVGGSSSIPDYSGQGTWTCDFILEEWFMVLQGFVLEGNVYDGGLQWVPIIYQTDIPGYYLTLMFVEQIPANSVVSYTYTYPNIPGFTYSLSGVSPVPVPVYGYNFSHEVIAYGQHGDSSAFANVDTGSLGMQTTPASFTVSRPPQLSGSSMSNGGTGISVSVTPHTAAGGDPAIVSGYMDGFSEGASKQGFHLSGNLDGMGDSLAVDTRLQVSGSALLPESDPSIPVNAGEFDYAESFVGGGSAVFYGYYTTAGNVFPTTAFWNFLPVGLMQVEAGMTGAQLNATGDDPNLIRVLMRGLSFDSFSIAQAPSVLIDDGSTLTPTSANGIEGEWQAAKPATITVSGGHLHVAVADAGKSAYIWRSFITATVPPFGSLSGQGWRYLHLLIKSSMPGAPLRLYPVHQSIFDPAKCPYWDVTLGAVDTFTDIYVDLCAPTNFIGNSDGKDSKMHGTALPVPGNILPPGWGWGFGVDYFLYMTLDKLAAGQTYDIAKIEFVRQDKLLFNALTSYYASPGVRDPQSGILLTVAPQRVWWAETDGRQSLEVYLLSDYNLGIDPHDLPNLSVTLAQMIDAVNTISPITGLPKTATYNGLPLVSPEDGWIAQAAAEFPDGYHTNDLPAGYLMGNGHLYAGGTMTRGTDIDLD